jgi:hypothetical protein
VLYTSGRNVFFWRNGVDLKIFFSFMDPGKYIAESVLKSIHKTLDKFWMTGSMLEKNKIRKRYIYLKINCIILALEWVNPQKTSSLDRLLEVRCPRVAAKSWSLVCSECARTHTTCVSSRKQ